MTPPVANFMARVQVVIAVGTFLVVLGLAAVGLIYRPFAFTMMVPVMLLSFLLSLLIPYAGLVISWMGIGKEAK